MKIMTTRKRPNVTVLGGFGFIGRHLVARLVRDGYPVTVFGHAAHEELAVEGPGTVRYCHGDFANAVELGQAIMGSEVIFHLIGNTVPQSSNANPRFDVDAHIGPTLTLFDLCREHGVRQVIFTSSGGTVYGITGQSPIPENHPTLPISSYGIQKITIEHYMRLYNRLHGLNATVLRIANPYGPGQNIGRNQGLIGMVCAKIKHHQAMEIWGDGTVVRDYIFIDDLVDAMERVILSVDGFEIYNVGTGIGTSINQVLDIFRSIGTFQLELKYRDGRPVDIPCNILDIGKIGQKFDWTPQIDLTSGIRETLDSCLERE